MPDPSEDTLAEATEDALLGGRVRLRQPATGYRAAVDPVLLAAAVPARPGERAAELGCGAGAAMLCLAARVPDLTVAGLELQPDLAGLARHNIAAGGLSGRLAAVAGDLRAPPQPPFAPGTFDHVLANPPHLAAGAGTPPPDAGKALAHAEGEADLDAWIAAARRLLRPRGRLTLIHRADRIDGICAALSGGFGAVTLIPLWPLADRPARRIIVRARKDVRSPAAVLPGLVLHRPDGGYTDAAEQVLRHGAALYPGPDQAN